MTDDIVTRLRTRLQRLRKDRDKWRTIADGLYECANDRCPVNCVTGEHCPRDDYREAVQA